MIKQCESHRGFDKKFVCIHKSQLLKENNKLSCQKCINCQKSNEFMKSMEELEDGAKENLNKYLEIQNKRINQNNEMKQRYTQSLTELQNQVIQYFQRQGKVITTLIEQQNHQITLNISKANSLLTKQSVMDPQSIDNFIIFITLNEAKQQVIENKYNQISNYLERQFNSEFAEIQCKTNQLTKIDIKFKNVPQFEVEEFKIETTEKNKSKLPFCKDHQMEKGSICTHENCLKEQPKQQYICIQCAMSNHEQHYKGNFVKTLKKIKQEQIEKLKLIEEQNRILKLEIESRVDKVLIEDQQRRQDNFDISEKVRQNLKLLEDQTIINPFDKNSRYIFHKIDQNLLSYDSAMIKLEFQSRLNEFEKLKQQNRCMEEEEFQQFCQTTENERLNYMQETIKLKNLAQQYEMQIIELQKKLEAQSIDSIIAEIRQSQKLIENTFKNYYQSILEGKDQISQQIQAVPKTVVENKLFASLQQDFFNMKKIVNKISEQIGSVPKIVVESKEFVSLQSQQQQLQNSVAETFKQLKKEQQFAQNTQIVSQLFQTLKSIQTTINNIHQFQKSQQMFMQSDQYKAQNMIGFVPQSLQQQQQQQQQQSVQAVQAYLTYNWKEK